MFDPMLEAYPNFLRQWKEFADQWSSGSESLPVYLLIDGIVRECSRMLAEGETLYVTNVLDVVERWLVEGDPYVQEAATVGFIEDLQNANLLEGTTPGDFIPFLGPESLYWWRKVDRFWTHGAPIVDTR